MSVRGVPGSMLPADRPCWMMERWWDGQTERWTDDDKVIHQVTQKSPRPHSPA